MTYQINLTNFSAAERAVEEAISAQVPVVQGLGAYQALQPTMSGTTSSMAGMAASGIIICQISSKNLSFIQ